MRARGHGVGELCRGARSGETCAPPCGALVGINTATVRLHDFVKMAKPKTGVPPRAIAGFAGPDKGLKNSLPVRRLECRGHGR